MARTGRPNKPSALKKREGNRGHRKIRDDVQGLGQPACPAYMSADQRMLWAATVSALPTGLLTSADSALLEQWAVAWQQFRDASIAIGKTGMVVQSAHGPIRNPFLAVQRHSMAAMNVIGQSMGLSPTARAKLVKPEAAGDDPMELLLAGMMEPDAPWSVARQ